MDVRDHGWFVFFAPRDNPEIAGVIFAEHAEHGYLGAPIAKYAIETYFAKKEGRPLPTLVKPPATVPIAAAGSTESTPVAVPAAAPAAGAGGHAGWRDTVRCSNDACSSTSTGSCSAPCCCSPGSAWR